jgi:hypothetical protein
MSEPTSTYTFLPWLRTGIGARLTQSSAGAGRASVQLKLHIEGDGTIRRTVNRSIELYGPGDILGVSIRAIVRTVPRPGTRDFESNFLAAIDFYDEDFPWRYSPAAPNANRVAPWLWLLTLDKTEFDLMPPLESGLPVVRLHPGVAQAALPKPNQTWAWAHAHVNFNVVENQNSQLEAVLQRLESELAKNPNLGCSRLLCPRRLKPETEYAAFLIPTFEKGRLAGLGADLSLIDSTNSLQAAWASPQAFLPDHFPIYYQWSFSTMPGPDFEGLAQKIEPVTRSQLLAAGIGTPLTMDIRSPGWGVKHGDPSPTVVLPTVFRLPDSPPDAEFPAPAPSKDAAWADSLAQLLNLSVQMQEGDAAFQQQNPIYQDAATIGNDPVVTPPLYGSWYVPPAKVEKGKMKTDWFHQMNLHPALRVVGGAGAEVIRDNQEDYMERAWEQCDEIGETNRFIKIAQLSSNVGMALFSKHLKASLDSLSVQTTSNQQVRALRLASMTRSAKVIASQAPSAQARSLISSGAVKMFRPNGALMTRLPPPLPPTGGGTAKFWLQDLRLKVVEGMIFVPPVFDVVQLTNTAVLNPNLPVILIAVQGLNGNKINSALETHKAYFLPNIIPLISQPTVSQTISERLRPDFAIAKKVRARLPEAVPPSAPTDDVGLLRVAPDFPEPMFDALAAQSLDLIMPGLDKFPVNRCGLFESSQTFIEAYLVGLNHEMAREMLWREFPADLRQTFFRQFWDKRDTPASTALSTAAGSFKDIRPIAEWGKPTPFGDASHRLGASTSLLFFVLRGDLLRKYPNTVVFMQPAIRNPSGRVPDETQPLKMPVASARLAQDIFFLGFDVPKGDAIGNTQKAGWYIGLQERPGDIHFGLDQSGATSPAEANWENADTLPGQCLDLEKPKPLFAGLRHAADVAVLFYQQPFVVLVHASKMLS